MWSGVAKRIRRQAHNLEIRGFDPHPRPHYISNLLGGGGAYGTSAKW